MRPDATRPVLVESRTATVRVLGTRFLVRLTQAGTQVTVVAGSVEVAARPPAAPPLRLGPGQQVWVAADGPGQPQSVSIHTATAWLRGRLIVEDMPLADVIAEVQRYRAGKVIFANPPPRSLRVNGNFDLSAPDAILETLDRTLPISLLHLTALYMVVY